MVDIKTKKVDQQELLMEKSIQSVITAIDEFDFDNITTIVQNCLDEGIDPLQIIQKGISKGLDIVGEKFDSGEYFLADLVMAGEIVNEVMPLLKENMNPGQSGQKGKIIMATVEGDIHEIGKNIVCMLLDANGYEVIDLGVDVTTEKILEKAKETGAHVIGLSCLLSTTIDGIKNLVESLEKEGIKNEVKVIIGGACTSEGLKTEMGADAYAETAIDAVKIVKNFTESGIAV